MPFFPLLSTSSSAWIACKTLEWKSDRQIGIKPVVNAGETVEDYDLHEKFMVDIEMNAIGMAYCDYVPHTDER